MIVIKITAGTSRIALLTLPLFDMIPITNGMSIPPNEPPSIINPPAVPLVLLNARVQADIISGQTADMPNPIIMYIETLTSGGWLI